jgi:hypothetical protein
VRQSFNIRLPAGKVWPAYESELTGGGRQIKRYNWIRIHNRGLVPIYADTKGIPSSNDLSEVWDIIGPGQLIVRNLGTMEDPEGWADELHILNPAGAAAAALALVEISDRPIVDIRSALLADANGNLAITLAGQAGFGDVNMRAQGTNLIASSPNDNQLASGSTLFVETFAELFNQTTGNWDRWRAASAAAMAAQSGTGVALIAAPGNWNASHSPAAGVQASASRAAGGAGVRHVASAMEIVISSQVAIAAGALTINLRDGASGAGVVLKSWVIQLPPAIIAPFVIPLHGRSILGSAATPMTLEAAAAYANLGVSLNLDGYDTA